MPPGKAVEMPSLKASDDSNVHLLETTFLLL